MCMVPLLHIFIMCYKRLEWIYTLPLIECQGIPCSKQARHLKLKWLNRSPNHNHLARKQRLNHLDKLLKWLKCIVSTYLHGAIIVCFYHVTYAFRVNLHSVIILNVNDLFTQNRCDILNLIDLNETWILDHLVWKRTPKHLAKMTKRLCCVVTTNLHDVFIMSEHR